MKYPFTEIRSISCWTWTTPTPIDEHKHIGEFEVSKWMCTIYVSSYYKLILHVQCLVLLKQQILKLKTVTCL